MDSSKLPAVLTEPAVKPAGMSIDAVCARDAHIDLDSRCSGGVFRRCRRVSIVKDAQEEKKDDPPAVDPAYVGTMSVKELPSIVTNLAEPEHVMIRLQAAILFDAKAIANPDVLAEPDCRRHSGFSDHRLRHRKSRVRAACNICGKT